MSKQKILIVDDIAQNIHILTQMLQDDYKIIATTKPQKVLDLAKKDPQPDLILLDIVMPVIDGYTLANRLKDDPKTKNIPVVFATSLQSEDDKNKGFEVGGVGFIQKPYKKDLILNVLNKALKEKGESMDTVLVVDDAPQNISLIVEILKQDYKVSVATSGKKALELLEHGLNPDILLLDVIMPDMDGFEVCTILKANDQYKNIPIIFLTILEDKEDVIKGLELGAVDYVSKPVEPAILKARVKTHLKLKHYATKLEEDLILKDEILLKQSKLAILGEMFEYIAHQWKQPLSIMNLSSGNIRVSKDFGTLNDDIIDDSLDNIETSIQYLNQTINDFRTFLKEDKQKEKINIKTSIQNTLTLLSSKFKSKEIEIVNELDDIEIVTYKNDLIQVFMNLLSNAEQALENVDGHRTIILESKINDNKLLLKISDNGGGIDSSVIDKVFEKHITTKENGSGIGLYMSKQLVEKKLNGTIKGYNIQNGACFEIELPI